MAQAALRTDEAVAPRVAPEIKPSAFTWDFQGLATGVAFVRLPQGVEWVDLGNSPMMWKRIQQNPRTALVLGDQMRAIAPDETWLAEGTVRHATHDAVYFAGLKRIDLERNAAAGAEHVVRWVRDGATQSVGYACIRLEDGKVLAGPYPRAELAAAAMPGKAP